MRCPPIDILVGFVYIEGAGVTPRPSVCYQFSNLRIAAVIRPEIVPARIVSAKTCWAAPSAYAVGVFSCSF